jgi:hypothetical protein
VLSQRLRRLADFPFAGQEDQDVAGAEPRHFVGGIDNGVVEIALVVLLVDILDRPVTHLDRVEPAGDFDHRRFFPLTVKCVEKRSASMVAEVMMSLRSGRLAATASGSRAGNRCSGCARAPRR